MEVFQIEDVPAQHPSEGFREFMKKRRVEHLALIEKALG